MTAFLGWLKQALATVYKSDGLLGIVVLVALLVTLLLALNIDAAQLVADWLGG